MIRRQSEPAPQAGPFKPTSLQRQWWASDPASFAVRWPEAVDRMRAWVAERPQVQLGRLR